MRRLSQWLGRSKETPVGVGDLTDEPTTKRKLEPDAESESLAIPPTPSRRRLSLDPDSEEKSSQRLLDASANDEETIVLWKKQEESKSITGDASLLGVACKGDAFEGQVTISRGAEAISINFCAVVLSERDVVCGIMGIDGKCLQAWISGASVRGLDGTDGRMRSLELEPHCDLKISSELAACLHLVGVLEGSGTKTTFRSHARLNQCGLWRLGEVASREEIQASFAMNLEPSRTVELDVGANRFTSEISGFRRQCESIAELLASSLPRSLQSADKLIEKLRSYQAQNDDIKVVLLGSPGSGKSKSGNGLFGAGILPAHGMGKSVTSAVIRIKHRPYTPHAASAPALYLLHLAESQCATSEAQSNDQRRYGAEVTFLSEAEWEEELKLLIDDLCEYWLESKGDKVIHKKPPMKDASCPGGYAAYAKLRAVYGEGLFASGRLIKTRSWESREDLIADINGFSARQSGKPVGIAALGTTIRIEEDMPQVFQNRFDRLVAQQLCSTESGQYWPLVKEVNLFTPSSILADGVVFYDCPGEGDSNPARDALARQVRKDADLVWIFCRVERALDENIGQDLLRASMREIMLDHASEDSFDVTFVAAKADQIVQSEVVQKLGLAKTATAREAALARRQYLKRAIAQEVKKMTGDGDLEDDAGFPFHVFGISALDYHRLTGMEDDKEAATFETIEETEIPGLRSSLHLQVALRRAVRQCKLLEYVDAELSSLIAQIRDQGGGSLQEGCLRVVEERLQTFAHRVEGVVSKIAESACEKLDAILTQIQRGAEIGQQQAKGKAEWWGKAPNSKHHATYAAIVRRHGRWSENGHDWPGEVAEPIYESFTKEWFEFFARGLTNFFDTLEGLLEPLQEELYQDLRRLHPRFWIFRPAAQKRFSLCLKELAELTTTQARQQQREISSEVQNGCQALLHETFDSAKDMRGTGSHHRRKAAIERGANEANYENATVGMVQGISALQEHFRKLKLSGPTQLSGAIHRSFKPLLSDEKCDSDDSDFEETALSHDDPSQESKLALPSLEVAQQNITEIRSKVEALINQMRLEQKSLQPALKLETPVAVPAAVGTLSPAIASADEVMRFFGFAQEMPVLMDA